MKATLSVCLIIKDEQHSLERCLASVKNIGNEIIVVDTGSTDDSITIAQDYTNRVYTFDWKNDFSSARNYGLEQAAGDWIFVIDGDEELDQKCLDSFQAILMHPEEEAFLVPINNLPPPSHELLAIPDLQPRLFKNNKGYRYTGSIHEQIIDVMHESHLSANIGIARQIKIYHYGYGEWKPLNRFKRNLDIVQQAFDVKKDQALRYYHLGIEYYKHGKFTEALEHLCFAFDNIEPEAACVPELVRAIPVCLYMLNRIPEALDFINDTALRVIPGMEDFFYIKGVMHKDLAQYTESYLSFKHSLAAPASSLHRANKFSLHRDKVYYYLGGLAEYYMDKDNSLLYYFQSLKENPYLTDSLKRMINILNPRLNPEYTIVSLNRVFDLSDLNLQMELALSCFEEGAYCLSLDLIKRLEMIGPISEDLRLLKGLCLLRNKNYKEAEEELLNITNDKVLYVKARQHLFLYYWLFEDYRKASGCLRRMKNAGALPTALYISSLLNREYTNKLNIDQNQAYILTKEFLELMVEIGDSYRVNEAFQNLSSILGERPSYLLAELFFKYEKYKLAGKEFIDLLDRGNSNAQIFYYLGRIYHFQRELNSAEEYYQKAIEHGLDTPKTRLESACLYQELAVQMIKEGLNGYPDNSDLYQKLQQLQNSLLD